MICVLQCTIPGLTQFLDPGPDIYLAQVIAPDTTGGSGTPVTCFVYAVDSPGSPPNQVVVTGSLPSLQINNTPQSFSVLPSTGNPMRLQFTVGNRVSGPNSLEKTNRWNSIDIRVQDSTGDQTAFTTIWYFISASGPGPTLPPPTTPGPHPVHPPVRTTPKKKSRR